MCIISPLVHCFIFNIIIILNIHRYRSNTSPVRGQLWNLDKSHNPKVFYWYIKYVVSNPLVNKSIGQETLPYEICFRSQLGWLGSERLKFLWRSQIEKLFYCLWKLIAYVVSLWYSKSLIFEINQCIEMYLFGIVENQRCPEQAIPNDIISHPTKYA